MLGINLTRIITVLAIFLNSAPCLQAQDFSTDLFNLVSEKYVPSKDSKGNLHFYYTCKDSTTTDEYRNVKIIGLQLHEFETEADKSSLRSFIKNKEGIFTLKLDKSDLKDLNFIQYSVNWSYVDKNGKTILNTTPRKNIVLKFYDDPKLEIYVHDKGFYYKDNLDTIYVKLKSNIEGAKLTDLDLKFHSSLQKIATLVNPDLILKTDFSEYKFIKNGEVNFIEDNEYLLIGNFTKDDLKYELTHPRKLSKENLVRIKPLHDKGKIINLIDNHPFKEIFDATGEAKEVTANFLKNDGKIYGVNLKQLENQRWQLELEGNENIAFGKHSLSFTGIDINNKPLVDSKFEFIKEPIKRKSIQVEFKKDKNSSFYEVTAIFTHDPLANVNLILDDFPLLMTQVSTDKTKFTKIFSLDDFSMKSFLPKLDKLSKENKPLLISTQIEKYSIDQSFVAVKANYVNIADYKGKSKEAIQTSLESKGFDDNSVKKLAKDIHSLANSENKNKETGIKIWDALLEWLPKTINLLFMII